jgi:hypothetical protein
MSKEPLERQKQETENHLLLKKGFAFFTLKRFKRFKLFFFLKSDGVVSDKILSAAGGKMVCRGASGQKSS